MGAICILILISNILANTNKSGNRNKNKNKNKAHNKGKTHLKTISKEKEGDAFEQLREMNNRAAASQVHIASEDTVARAAGNVNIDYNGLLDIFNTPNFLEKK